ncbi:unnamed protein product, partial [Didymodactylos carnosus]
MEENTNPKLFEDIDAWEIDAIGKVKETAEQVRQELRQILNAPLKQLKCLTDDIQREKDYSEFDLERWRNDIA